jgi:hypothetical protein
VDREHLLPLRAIEVGTTARVVTSRWRRWRRAGASMGLGSALLSVSLVLASAPVIPKLRMEVAANPPANISPVPNFLASGPCYAVGGGGYACANPCITTDLKWPVFSTDPRCDSLVLEAINNARAQENVKPMVLPTNWSDLTIAQQLFVAANLERVDRGYPPYLGLDAKLNAEAERAAATNDDPALAPGFSVGYNAIGVQAMGGSWSGGFNVLSADYIWYYDDGWSGNAATTSNIICRSANDVGCWGHRMELLGSAPKLNPGVSLYCTTCEMGAGYSVVSGRSSFVDIIEYPLRGVTRMTFTWAKELPFFPSGYSPSTRNLSVKPVSLNTTSLRLRWGITNVQGTQKIEVYTFRSYSCRLRTHYRAYRYLPAFNLHGGVVTLAGANYFAPHDVYSAVVRLTFQGQTITSNCVHLGRS